MPIENAAPQLGQQDAVGLLFSSSNAAVAAGKPLQVINQSVSASEKAAVKQSVDAASMVADQLSQSIVAQAANKQRAIDAVRTGAVADEVILRDQQERARQAVEFNRKAVDLYGADALDPDSLAAKQAASYADIRSRRLDVQQQLLDMQNIDMVSDPYGWIMAQFNKSGLVEQHNQLAVMENTLTAEMQAGHQMAANQAELQKSLTPVQSLEAEQAAISKVRSAAELQEIEIDYKMTNAINQDAVSMASILANRAGQIRSLGQEERQLQAQRINSLNESTKWEAGKIMRQWQAMSAERDVGVQATFERGEQLLGLERGTAKTLMDDVARSGNHEDYAALVKYFWSGSFADPEIAARVAKYTNYQGLERKAMSSPDILTRESAASVLEMTRWLNKAQSDFALEAKNKGIVFTSDEERQAALVEFTRKNIIDNVNKKILSVTPAQLNAVTSGEIVKQFPALQAAVDMPNEQGSDDRVLGAFREYYKTRGGDSAAAKAFADYNTTRMQLVVDKTLTMQAGVKKPTNFMTTVTVQHPLLPGSTEYKLNMTDPASIERYMLLSKPDVRPGGGYEVSHIYNFYTKP